MEQVEREIGEAAGKIWEALHVNGAMSRAKIAKATKLSAQLVNQGIGWLAREGQLTSEKMKGTEAIRLKQQV